MPHLGKRGRVLLFLGVLDLVYALRLIKPSEAPSDGTLAYWLGGAAPICAALWATVGAVCLWQAFCRRDSIGYAAAILVKLTWGVVCLIGWLFGGVGDGYVSIVIWLGLAWAVVWNCATWSEPGDGKGPAWRRRTSSP